MTIGVHLCTANAADEATLEQQLVDFGLLVFVDGYQADPKEVGVGPK